MIKEIKNKWSNLDNNKKRAVVISTCATTVILAGVFGNHLGKRKQIKINDLEWKRKLEKYSSSRLALFERSDELPYGIHLLYETPDGKEYITMGEMAFKSLDSFSKEWNTINDYVRNWIDERKS